MTHLPSLSSDLVRELDASHPPRCIMPNESLESAHRYAGARELIDGLLARLNVDSGSVLKDRIDVLKLP